MDIMSIVFPIIAIGGMGVLFGLFLGFAGVKFKVEQDPKIPDIRDALPGANCGGCGYAGCDALAEAIATGKAPINACPVGGAAVAEKVAAIMGVEAVEGEKMAAFVKCSGDCEKAGNKFEYKGIEDCKYEAALNGGSKACSYGCLGDGNCVRVCRFGALSIVNGVAVVDESKCTACGQCVKACPKHLIELVPVNNKVRVHCSSHDMPKAVKENCSVGCWGCSLCKRTCQYEAIEINNFLASVNYEKCTQCGACTEKCPSKAIRKEA